METLLTYWWKYYSNNADHNSKIITIKLEMTLDPFLSEKYTNDSLCHYIACRLSKWTVLRIYQSILTRFYNGGLWENIFWYNWLKNNSAQLYFPLGRAKPRYNYSSLLKDASDIHRFPTVHMVKTHFLLENLWIAEPSSGILEKFQHSSALPNV